MIYRRKERHNIGGKIFRTVSKSETSCHWEWLRLFKGITFLYQCIPVILAVCSNVWHFRHHQSFLSCLHQHWGWCRIEKILLTMFWSHFCKNKNNHYDYLVAFPISPGFLFIYLFAHAVYLQTSFPVTKRGWNCRGYLSWRSALEQLILGQMRSECGPKNVWSVFAKQMREYFLTCYKYSCAIPLFDLILSSPNSVCTKRMSV